MRSRSPRVWWLAPLVLSGCLTTPAPRVPLDALAPSQLAPAQERLRVFNRVWSLVADWHYDRAAREADWRAAGEKFGPRAAAAADEKSLYAVLNDMIASLKDSHTYALTPAQAADRAAHTHARTGFALQRLGGRWVVDDVVAGSPAEAGGVQVGWCVLTRNGQPLGEVLDFRPREGDAVRWEFLDANDRPVALTLLAKNISTRAQKQVRVLDGGFVYLRFDEFDSEDRRWLAEQLALHRAAPGLVLDLRRNSGGSTFALGIVAGEFFDRSVDCGMFLRGRFRDRKTSWPIGSVRYRGRIAVLVDRATASAAEILAAVLKEHGRATLVGRPTEGAVLASIFLPLPDHGELQLSVEDYLTPHGQRLEGHGLEPDVKITRTFEELRAGRDADIEAALHVLRQP